MGKFLEIALGYPTIVFSVLLVITMGYFLLTFLLGGADVDFDVEVDAGLEAGTESGNEADTGSGLGALLRTFDLHLIPISLAVALISLFGWMTSFVTSWILSGAMDVAVVGTIVGVAILAGSFATGIFFAGRTGRLLAPIFSSAPSVRHADLIGRLCTVRTGSVSRGFGQAEVVDAEHSSHLIQVRCDIANSLTAGAQALIVSVNDDGLFQISPDIDVIA